MRVGDERERDAVAEQLVRGEPRALQLRARLAHVHRAQLARAPSGADDAERRAVTAGGEVAGIAMGEHLHAVGQQRLAGGADAAACLDIVSVQRRGRDLQLCGDGLGRRTAVDVALGLVEQFVDRPRQVDRGRPRRRERLRRVGEHGEEMVRAIGFLRRVERRDRQAVCRLRCRWPARRARASRGSR